MRHIITKIGTSLRIEFDCNINLTSSSEIDVDDFQNLYSAIMEESEYELYQKLIKIFSQFEEGTTLKIICIDQAVQDMIILKRLCPDYVEEVENEILETLIES